MLNESEFIPDLEEKASQIDSSLTDFYDSWIPYIDGENDLRDKLGRFLKPVFDQINYAMQQKNQELADAYRIINRLIYGGPLDKKTHEAFGDEYDFWSFHQGRKPSGNLNPSESGFFNFPGIYELLKLVFAFRYGYENSWSSYDSKEGSSTGGFQALQDLMMYGTEYDLDLGKNVPKVVAYLKREMMKQQEPFTPDSEMGRRVIEMVTTQEFVEKVGEEAVGSVTAAVHGRISHELQELLGGDKEYEVTVNEEQKKVKITKAERGKQLAVLLDQMLLERKRREMVKEIDGQRFRMARETAKVA